MADSKDNIVRTDRFQGPSSGSTGDGGSDVLMKDYIDARDDAIESRLGQKLDKLSTTATIWTAMGTALGIVLAAWALAGDRFDAGLSVSPAIARIQDRQDAVDNRQNAKLDTLNNKLDTLLERTINEKSDKR